MPYKLIITIRYIFIIIIALCLFALAYAAYDNLNNVRKSTNQLDESINNVIIEWTSDYANDTAMLQQIDEDLAASETKLNAMFKEAEIIIGE